MNFKSILIAAAIAFVPAASYAVTVPVPITDIASPNELSAGVYRYDVDFFDGDSGETVDFEFINDTGSAFVLALAEGTVNQLSAHFSDGVTLTWLISGDTDSVDENGQPDTGLGPLTSSVLGAGASEILRLTFGDVVENTSGGVANIDFQVFAQPVPVPAGLLLMGTALAGFGVMRRRKKVA